MTTFNIFHTTRVRIGVRDAPHIWGAGEIGDAGERRLFGGLARSEPFVTPHIWGTGEMSTEISATYLGRWGNKHWKSRRMYVAQGHDELRAWNSLFSCGTVLLLLVSISWQFREYPSISYSVILPTNTDPENIKMNHVSNDHPSNFPDCSLCHSRHILKISWKSTSFFITSLTNTDPGKRKTDPGFKGLIASSRKCVDWSLYQVPPILKMSWKSLQPFSRNVVNRHGFPRKRPKKSLCSRGLMNHFENVPDCSLYQVPPILKMSWRSVKLFLLYEKNEEKCSLHRK